jgi:hypothetical protein
LRAESGWGVSEIKKRLGIIVFLLFCCILVMPVNAFRPPVAPWMSLEVHTPGNNVCVRPGDFISYVVRFEPSSRYYDEEINFSWWELILRTSGEYLEYLGSYSWNQGCGHLIEGPYWMDCEEAEHPEGPPGWEPENSYYPYQSDYIVKDSTPPGAHIIANLFGRYLFSDNGIHEEKNFYSSNKLTAPEFPSPFLPISAIFGFLGAVLLIQRTREQ